MANPLSIIKALEALALARAGSEVSQAVKPAEDSKFADGGSVKPAEKRQPLSIDDPRFTLTPSLFVVPSYADYTTSAMYPNEQGYDNQRDAARHMLAAGSLARSFNPAIAEALGKYHEWATSPLAAMKYAVGMGKMPRDYEYDLHNNRVGIDLAKQAVDQAHLEDLVKEMSARAQYGMTPGVAAMPPQQKPVKKASGGLAQYKECNCHG